MTIIDGRIAAWTAAWQCIEGAQQVRTAAAKLPRNPDDLDARKLHAQQYGSLMSEAHAFISLSGVDLSVGIGAGEWLRQQWEAQQEDAERRAFISDIFEKHTS